MKSTIPILAGLGLILGGVLPASALPSEELRKSYCEYGFVAFTWGKFGEAERLFHLAMLEADEVGVKDTMYAVSLRGRARAFDMLGRYADADEHYKRALALHERLNGGDSEYVAEVRDDLTKLNEKLAVANRKLEVVNRLRTQEDAIEFYFRKEDFKSAEKACTNAIEAAVQAMDAVVETRLEARLVEIKHALELKPEADAALCTLSDTPADENASSVLGRFLCFVTEDWENGLPLLAVGAEVDSLYLPAQLDHRNPRTAKEQLDVADRWFNLTDEGCPGAPRAPQGEQAAIRKRALHWYRAALASSPALPAGFDRVKAQRRLDQLSGK